MRRRLVITADDLGRDAVGTRVIQELLAEGAITQTSLITVSPHSQQAARSLTGSGVQPHLHLTLTSEPELAPWTPHSAGPSLRDSGGSLRTDPVRAEREIDLDELREELQAQWEWAHRAGLRPRVADSHAGVLYGLHGAPLLPVVLAWCAENGLGFRLPRDPRLVLGGPPGAEIASRLRQAVEFADEHGVALPAAVITHRRTTESPGGRQGLRDALIAQLRQLPEGTSELILHPSADGPGVPPIRAWEAAVLRDPVWRDALEREALELVQQW